MLAPAVLWLLVSLTSSPTPCLAADLEHVWASLLAGDEGQEPWRPPVDHLYNPPQNPDQEPEWQSKWQGPARRDILSMLKLPPPRPMELQRLYKPWGDGFVRMPVQRQVFNDTRHRRSGRLRRPNRPTYPATSVNGNPTEIPTPENDTIIHDHDAESSQERRDVAASSPPSNPGPDYIGAKDPMWGWSHLDDFMGVSYMLQLDIGTPPQKVGVLVDTGSYELWVNPKCTQASDPALCRAFGHYYPQLSSTSAKKDENFRAVYGTGEAAGKYFTDSIKVSIWNVPSIQFAVADDTNYTFSGVLGLGYSFPYTTKYPTLLSTMWRLGYIAAPVFSMGLGGQSDGKSEIIFGGVNRFRYAGRLEPVDIWPPIDKQDPTWLQYWVNVTGIGLSKPNGGGTWRYTSKSFSFPMLIDTGSTLSYIREDVVKIISENMGGWVDEQGNYLVDCALRKTNGTVNFGFKGKDALITVSYKDFIWEQQKPQRCFLGFQPADKGTTNWVLGDTFIRGAYLVFDQQVDVVWMADYYECGDGVQMVGESPADAWNAIGQCSP